MEVSVPGCASCSRTGRQVFTKRACHRRHSQQQQLCLPLCRQQLSHQWLLLVTTCIPMYSTACPPLCKSRRQPVSGTATSSPFCMLCMPLAVLSVAATKNRLLCCCTAALAVTAGCVPVCAREQLAAAPPAQAVAADLRPLTMHAAGT
jgi:hypothetical protein